MARTTDDPDDPYALADRLYGHIPPIGHTTAIAVETLRDAAALLRSLAAERDNWRQMQRTALDSAHINRLRAEQAEARERALREALIWVEDEESAALLDLFRKHAEMVDTYKVIRDKRQRALAATPERPGTKPDIIFDSPEAEAKFWRTVADEPQEDDRG